MVGSSPEKAANGKGRGHIDTLKLKGEPPNDISSILFISNYDSKRPVVKDIGADGAISGG